MGHSGTSLITTTDATLFARLNGSCGAADFTIERITYFNTFLFPPIAAVRLLARYGRQPHNEEGDFAYARNPSNPVLGSLFAAERVFLRYLDFPFGVSVFAAARKLDAPHPSSHAMPML